MKAFLFCTFA